MTRTVIAVAAGLLFAPAAVAQGKAALARETAEFALRKFGLTAAREGVEVLTQRVAAAALRHGDEAFVAVRRVGPRALTLGEEAGEQAPRAFRLMARHGEEGAVWVLARPKAVGIVTRFGEDAASVLVKHKGLAEPLIESGGAPALKALGAVGPQGGRRLAMMAESGELAAIGRTPELMEVVAKHGGDRAMDFVWRNKGALAVTATTAAFLADPEKFLDGTAKLTGAVAEHVVKPVVAETGHVVSTLLWVGLVGGGLLVALVARLAVKHPDALLTVGKLVRSR